MYGLTEAFRSTYLPPSELDRRPTSMGKAIPDTEILVLDENNRLCKPGQVGELVHRGPTVSMGCFRAVRRTPTRHCVLTCCRCRRSWATARRVCYSGDLAEDGRRGLLILRWAAAIR